MTWLDGILEHRAWSGILRPYPRIVVDVETWRRASVELAEMRATLLSLWGERDAVHLALEVDGRIAVLSLACPARSFPSIASRHAPALRLERTISDLHGLEPLDCPDRRRWLDHGRWGVRYPLGMRRAEPASGDAYAFLGAEGPALHQIPVGPVHAGIIEPGHFRFTASGETVVRLEERLGYVHKGIDQLMIGSSLERAAKLAGRVSGDSTVAYSIAFARAVECATAAEPPSRAVWLRALMAELERLANHFGDIGAVCNDASFSLMHAHCGILREEVLRLSDACFGHRLMMDCVVPGGVSVDLDPPAHSLMGSTLKRIQSRFSELVELYDNTASLQNRTVSTGFLAPDMARRYAAGGFVGRASGRNHDARKTQGYAPYDQLSFEVPVRQEGDVDARVWVRIREVEQSIKLIDEVLARLPMGPVRSPMENALPVHTAEGLAIVEGFRGDVLAWVRLGADGRIARCHLRDPSWFQWPLLEAVIEGNIVADFPLCNKSFNCSYSGHDL
jgi:Ni,Fe-hydrogenase III large subunit